MMTFLLTLCFSATIAFSASEPPTTQETPAEVDTEDASEASPKIDPELVRRLLGGESTTLDNVTETLTRMEQAEKLLTEALDCGEETQQVQQQIIAGIDMLIEEARKNQVSARGGSQYRRRREARPTPRPAPGEDSASRSGTKGDKAGQAGHAPAGGDSGAASQQNQTKAELARGWGYLPQRDRDEIAQGFDEEFIAKYREQIRRYYRQLAEQAQDRKTDLNRIDQKNFDAPVSPRELKNPDSSSTRDSSQDR